MGDCVLNAVTYSRNSCKLSNTITASLKYLKCIKIYTFVKSCCNKFSIQHFEKNTI